MSCDNCTFRKGNPCTADIKACEYHTHMEYISEIKSQLDYWKKMYRRERFAG